jgi:hypothetical protein
MSDDRRLQGIINLEGITTMLRSIGNERYPGVAYADWDPAIYRYNESMAHRVKPISVWEDSPGELARMRAICQHSITKRKKNCMERTRAFQALRVAPI